MPWVFFVLLGYPLGGGRIDALYLSLFCSLSSTAIVVKLLYDKFELDTLPGRISLGILIFQDLWAILILALQPNFMNPKAHLVVLALGKAVLLLAVGFLLNRYVLRWIFCTYCQNAGNGSGHVHRLVRVYGGIAIMDRHVLKPRSFSQQFPICC